MQLVLEHECRLVFAFLLFQVRVWVGILHASERCVSINTKKNAISQPVRPLPFPQLLYPSSYNEQ